MSFAKLFVCDGRWRSRSEAMKTAGGLRDEDREVSATSHFAMKEIGRSVSPCASAGCGCHTVSRFLCVRVGRMRLSRGAAFPGCVGRRDALVRRCGSSRSGLEAMEAGRRPFSTVAVKLDSCGLAIASRRFCERRVGRRVDD